MNRDEQRAVIAAVLAYSNLGHPLSGPHTDKQTIERIKWVREHPSRDARSNIINLCGHLIETDEMQKVFEREARSWSGTLRKMNNKEIANTWPDVCILVLTGHQYNEAHKTERCATIRNQALIRARDRRTK